MKVAGGEMRKCALDGCDNVVPPRRNTGGLPKKFCCYQHGKKQHRQLHKPTLTPAQKSRKAETQRLWNAANRERQRARVRKYRDRNREASRQWYKKWYSANRDKVRRRASEWYAKHRRYAIDRATQRDRQTRSFYRWLATVAALRSIASILDRATQQTKERSKMTTHQKLRRLIQLLKDIAVHIEEAVGIYRDLMKAGYDRDRILQLAVKDGANREIVRRTLQICYAVNEEQLHPAIIKHLESYPNELQKAVNLGPDEQAKLLDMAPDEAAKSLRRRKTPRPQQADDLASVTRCQGGVKIVAAGTSLILSESAAVHLAKTVLSMIGQTEAA